MLKAFLLVLLFCSVHAIERLKSENTDALEASLSLNKPYMTIEGEKLTKHWSTVGDAVLEQNFIRLNPVASGKRGLIYNTEEVSTDNWEAIMEFGVLRESKSGDGMAFWYLTQPGLVGDAYGGQPKWTGFAVFVDTGDEKNPPYISLQSNDGTHALQRNDSRANELGGCSLKAAVAEDGLLPRAFWIKMKVRYLNGFLTVLQRHKAGSSYETCVNVEVKLNAGNRLQVSSSTDQTSSDSHLLYSLRFFDLEPIADEPLASLKAHLKFLEDKEEQEHPLHMTKLKAKQNPVKPNVAVTSTPSSTSSPPAASTSNNAAPGINELAQLVHDLKTKSNEFSTLYNQVVQDMNTITQKTRDIGAMQSAVDLLSRTLETVESQIADKASLGHLKLQGTSLGNTLDHIKNEMNTVRDRGRALYADNPALVNSLRNLMTSADNCASDVDLIVDVQAKFDKTHSELREQTHSFLGLTKGHYFLLVEAVAVAAFFFLFRGKSRAQQQRGRGGLMY